MRKILLSLLVALMMLSCNKMPSAEKIKKLESQLVNEGGSLNMEVAAELVDIYLLRAENKPEAATAPEDVFKALDISVNLNFDNPQKTIEIADIMINQYPDYAWTPMAMFIKGFIYESRMNDKTKAIDVYNQFIERYPDNELIENVKSTLENIHLTPEELIRKFESEN